MGNIRYEYNPPKVQPNTDINTTVTIGMERLITIAPKCDAIHITENVLGFERVSPITMGVKLKEILPQTSVTVSLRVRDKTESEISVFVDQCIDAKFDGVLILMGDPSRDGRPDTGQIPSTVTENLKECGINSKIELYMSISNEPSATQIQKKIMVQPNGFFTQVVQSAQQVKNLTKYMYGLRIIPVVLLPSPKNKKSAEFLNLDMDAYTDNFYEFVKEVYDITEDILITSPNDFAAVNEFLSSSKLY